MYYERKFVTETSLFMCEKAEKEYDSKTNREGKKRYQRAGRYEL